MSSRYVSWIESATNAQLSVEVDGDPVGTSRTINFSDDFSATFDGVNDRVNVSFAAPVAAMATITGSGTSTTVNLTTAQPTATYLVHCTIVSGTSGATYSLPYVSNRATGSFQINLSSAPGTSQRVGIAWIIAGTE